MKTQKLAAYTSCVFSYCVFLNTPEAAAFSEIKIPVPGVSPAIASKSSLAATGASHQSNCPCTSCRMEPNKQLNRRVTHGAACDCSDCRVTHGAACDCSDCSGVHPPACPCNACSRAAHGVGCNCSSCKL